MHDQVRIVALGAIAVVHLGKHLGIGTVDRFHRRFVAEPSHLDLVESHALDDAGVVGRKEGRDFQPRLLGHVVDQGLPVGLQILSGLGGDDAEVDVLRPGGGQGQAKRDGSEGVFDHGSFLESIRVDAERERSGSLSQR